jgi:2-oxoisovalerate dehydrogenase E1 component
MQLARNVDNRVLELFRQGLIRGTVTGGQGNESLIVPLTLLADKAIDVISFTHRDLGGHLIWSQHLCEHLNQYFANAGSPTQAREGNVHHGDPAARSLPMVSHLGAMLSCVAGSTDSQRRKGKAALGFAFFGDGGSSTGDIHETLNLASLLSLPIIFVIENNHYAYSTPTSEQFAEGVELWKRAAGYGIESHRLDCTNTEEVLRFFAKLGDDVRAHPRPVLVEAQVLRLRGHAAYDTCDYLKAGENDAFFAADPLPKLRTRLVEGLGAAKMDAADHEISVFVEACIHESMAVGRPVPANMEADLYAPDTPALPWIPSLGSKPSASEKPEQLNLAQAINRALRKVLTERPESLVLGQDIATYGGAFKVTDGLFSDFGRTRVFNTPLAESACTGYCIGMALNGHRPILEYQFSDFVTEAITQVTQNAATFHFRSGAPVPMVLRLPTGGGLTFGSFHSQELDSLLLSVPGLKALYPSTPQDAFNAVLAAYEDNNPVLLFEHKGLYRGAKGLVSWDPNYRDVWQPRRLREGKFATFVTYGEMSVLAGELCDYFSSEFERSFDLWDLRGLSPLRLEEIEKSVARTHRLIVMHEGHRTHGFGAELVARLTEKLFYSLEAPPLRLSSLDIPVPFAPELEKAYRPTFDSAAARITAWLG